MIENNHGHIVTIASMGGLLGVTKMIDYCATKHAVVGFDESLRHELQYLGCISNPKIAIKLRFVLFVFS